MVSKADVGYKVSMRLAIATAACAVIGGVAIVVGGPLALGAVGFSSIGPVAGRQILAYPCINLVVK